MAKAEAEGSVNAREGWNGERLDGPVSRFEHKRVRTRVTRAAHLQKMAAFLI